MEANRCWALKRMRIRRKKSNQRDNFSTATKTQVTRKGIDCRIMRVSALLKVRMTARKEHPCRLIETLFISKVTIKRRSCWYDNSSPISCLESQLRLSYLAPVSNKINLDRANKSKATHLSSQEIDHIMRILRQSHISRSLCVLHLLQRALLSCMPTRTVNYTKVETNQLSLLSKDQ